MINHLDIYWWTLPIYFSRPIAAEVANHKIKMMAEALDMKTLGTKCVMDKVTRT